MIESLIASKTRVKLLLKFFLNAQTKSYLRGLETEFGESSNAIRLELNKLATAGLLSTSTKGNKKIFFANTTHPLFGDIHSILLKCVGIDHIIEHFISRVGHLQAAYITGDLAIGKDSNIIDLALVGDHLDRMSIDGLIENTETFIHRRIKYLPLTADEMKTYFANQPFLLIWKAE